MLRDEIEKSFKDNDIYASMINLFCNDVIDWCVTEVEKRVNEIKARIKLDKETFKACSRDIKGHNRALMLIDEVMNGK